MINGNANDFLETIYSAQEVIHIYKGIKYCIQGWTENNMFVLNMQEWEPNPKIIWQYTDISMFQCRERYLQEPLYNGKTFWEAEQDIEWVDD